MDILAQSFQNLEHNRQTLYWKRYHAAAGGN